MFSIVYTADFADANELTLLFNAVSDDVPLVAVFRPGNDEDAVMADFLHPGLQPGQVHAERIQDRRLATDPRLRMHESLTYRDAARLVPDEHVP